MLGRSSKSELERRIATLSDRLRKDEARISHISRLIKAFEHAHTVCQDPAIPKRIASLTADRKLLQISVKGMRDHVRDIKYRLDLQRLRKKV